MEGKTHHSQFLKTDAGWKRHLDKTVAGSRRFINFLVEYDWVLKTQEKLDITVHIKLI